MRETYQSGFRAAIGEAGLRGEDCVLRTGDSIPFLSTLSPQSSARPYSIKCPKRSKRGIASQLCVVSRDQYTKVALPLMSAMLAKPQKRLS